MHRIECPSCRHRIMYKDEHAGKKAKCQKCSHSFRLPLPAIAGRPPVPVPIAAAVAAAADPEEPDETQAPMTDLRATLYAVAALVGLLIVGVVVLSVFGVEVATKSFLVFFSGKIIVGSVLSLMGAVVLRAAAWWAEKLDFPYGAAYLTTLLSYLISAALVLTIACLFPSPRGIGLDDMLLPSPGGLREVLWQMPVNLAVWVVLVRTRHRLAFAKAAKIVGVMLLIVLVIGAVLGGFAGLVLWLTSR